MFARQQAAAIIKIQAELNTLGVSLVAIGNGSPEQARDFADKFGFTGELFVDEGLQTYKAFGLKRGFWKTLGPASVVRGFKTMGQGFRQGRSAGDLWQQGGIFVIGPGNRILFSHINERAGDQADPKAVLEACRINSNI